MNKKWKVTRYYFALMFSFISTFKHDSEALTSALIPGAFRVKREKSEKVSGRSNTDFLVSALVTVK
jgi:hypothetical protein